MANVMSLKKLRNKPSRNGFDLSRKNIFSAKVGELLPVMCVECIPGDKFKVNLKNFTRTMPINTAAYTRIREYFDFFFVPTELMWHKYNTWVSQMTDNNQHATSITANTQLTDRHPYFSMQGLLGKIESIDAAAQTKLNPLGYRRLPQSVKLLNYLNYGQFTCSGTVGQIGHRYAKDVAVNPFPLMAYQKIYADYYRNSQWENSFAPAFNCDYVRGDSDLELPVQSAGNEYGQMWDLRYCNWNKDLFMGVLPNSQFGDAASINLSSLDSGQTALFEQTPAGAGTTDSTFSGIISDVGGTQVDTNRNDSFNKYYAFSNSQGPSGQLRLRLSPADTLKLRQSLGLSADQTNTFTILALRQAEALQKWAEISQSQSKDYKAQMEAHFGVSLSDAYSDRCQFIDGIVNTIDINEVVNQNITSTNAAEIAGKGVGVGDGYLNFSADVHGYFICIYHAIPLLDYAVSGVDKHNLKTYATDYAIPELDACGMVEVPWIELNSSEIDAGVNTSKDGIGFAPRYYEYKTAVDRVHGAFVHGGLDAWVAPLTDAYMTSILDVNPSSPTYEVNYKYFKVNPNILDPIFAKNSGDFVDSDQLLVNSNFDIKAVRNLDYNGLPY